MAASDSKNLVKIRARSPGKYPILVLELSPEELRTAYYETGYDLGRAKPVKEEWLQENALGRHSFVEVEPPEEIDPEALEDFVRRQFLGES
ncbi:MAG: hypothetical protein ACFB50_12440 [Rubrobacteraceae bacterium]